MFGSHRHARFALAAWVALAVLAACLVIGAGAHVAVPGDSIASSSAGVLDAHALPGSARLASVSSLERSTGSASALLVVACALCGALATAASEQGVSPALSRISSPLRI